MKEFVLTVQAPDDWNPAHHFQPPVKLIGFSSAELKPITQVVEPYGFTVHRSMGSNGG